MKRKFATFAVALAMSVLGLAGAVTAGHYAATDDVETAIRDYEAQTSPLATHNEDPIGITGDGSIDTTGVIFPACRSDGNTSGSYSYGLRCNNTDDIDGDGVKDPLPDGPYDRAESSVNDQLSANVYILLTTCSNDGDNVCGEAWDNVNESTAPGPNELRDGACTPGLATIERGPNDLTDGTGDGVWNQTGEFYDADGDGVAETPHPGVDEVVVFVLDPIWEALFTNDACNGVSQWASTGTVTITGT